MAELGSDYVADGALIVRVSDIVAVVVPPEAALAKYGLRLCLHPHGAERVEWVEVAYSVRLARDQMFTALKMAMGLTDEVPYGG